MKFEKGKKVKTNQGIVLTMEKDFGWYFESTDGIGYAYSHCKESDCEEITPTLEEVKEYFKDAKEVRSLYKDKVLIYSGNINIDKYEVDSDEIWDGDDILLWENGKYAEIVSYKDKQDKPKLDPIVTSVMTQLLTRSQLGISKYGTTLKDNNTDDFLQHLKEELMDAILYIEKLQDEKV